MFWMVLGWMMTVAVIGWRLSRIERMLVEARGMLATARGLVHTAEACTTKVLAAVEQLVELAEVERETTELQVRVGEQLGRGEIEPRPEEAAEACPPSGEARALRDAAAADGDEPEEELTQVVPFERPRLLRGPSVAAVAPAGAAGEGCRTEDEVAVLAALVELQSRLGLAGLATVGLAQRVCRLGRARSVPLRRMSEAIAGVAYEAARGTELRVVVGIVIKHVLLAKDLEAPAGAGGRVTQLPGAPSAPRGAA